MAEAGSPPSFDKVWRDAMNLPGLAANQLKPAIAIPNCGSGEPVVTIPGMLSGDSAMDYLRRSINASGFVAHGSGLIFNTGATQRRVELVADGIRKVAEDAGQSVMLVGWSLGGLYARLLGHRYPQYISRIITLGTPFSGDPHANNAWKLYEAINGHKVTEPPFPEDFSSKPEAETIAVWSGNDGIIAPDAACGTEEQSDWQIEVSCGHFAMSTDEACVRTVIAALAGLS